MSTGECSGLRVSLLFLRWAQCSLLRRPTPSSPAVRRCRILSGAAHTWMMMFYATSVIFVEGGADPSIIITSPAIGFPSLSVFGANGLSRWHLNSMFVPVLYHRQSPFMPRSDFSHKRAATTTNVCVLTMKHGSRISL